MGVSGATAAGGAGAACDACDGGGGAPKNILCLASATSYAGCGGGAAGCQGACAVYGAGGAGGATGAGLPTNKGGCPPGRTTGPPTSTDGFGIPSPTCSSLGPLVPPVPGLGDVVPGTESDASFLLLTASAIPSGFVNPDVCASP